MAVGTAKAAAERRQQKLAEETRVYDHHGHPSFCRCPWASGSRLFAPVSSQATLPDKAGEPRKISNLFLASSLCQKQAGINYRGNLVNAVTDDFSTRHDYPRDLFVVLLLVSVYEPAKRTME